MPKFFSPIATILAIFLPEVEADQSGWMSFSGKGPAASAPMTQYLRVRK